MICQNDPCAKQSVKMTFPDPYHEQHWHDTLHKDHFDILHVRFDGGCVDQDEGFGDVWDIHASVVQDRGLEMSFWHLALYRDHFDIS